MSAFAGAKRELEALAAVEPELARGGLAGLIMRLAKAVDKPDSTTSQAAAARALTEALKELRSLVPDKPEGDELSDLTARHAANLPGQPAAAH